MKAVGNTPALGASLNISGANFDIALGILLGSRVIELAGLARGRQAAAIVVVAVAVTWVLARGRNSARRAPTDADGRLLEHASVEAGCSCPNP